MIYINKGCGCVELIERNINTKSKREDKRMDDYSDSKERLYLSTLAFIDDESVTTNRRYLEEFCKIVIFSSDYSGINISDIKGEIQKLIGFEYSEDEILEIMETNSTDFIYDGERYSLSSECNREIQQREKNFQLRKYIDTYLDLKNEKTSEKERNAKCDLITRFIFLKFQQSIDQIIGIIQSDTVYTITSDNDDYSDDERNFINDFLMWENKSKNEMIYTLIVKSYDFCTINCPEQIEFKFEDFRFYLDANIIMRLLGINNLRRQKAVSHFIEKCKELEIGLYITNFTKDEIKKSIRTKIDAIARDLERYKYVPSPNSIKFAKSDAYPIEMYGKYYEYYNKNKEANLEKFYRYLIGQLDNMISGFKYEEKNSYEIEDNNNFVKYYSGLKKIKDEKVVKTDVNNILFLLEKRNVEKNSYIISADSRLIEWCKSIFVGQTSLVEFPSVWLSIMLKYTGRVEGEDYAAFCKFIKLPIQPKEKDLLKKTKIRDEVLKMDITNRIKDLMFQELENGYYDYSDKRSAKKIADSVYEEVMKQHDQSIRDEMQKKHDEEMLQRDENDKSIRSSLGRQINEEHNKKEEALRQTVPAKIAKLVDEKIEKKLSRREYVKKHHNRFMAGLILLIAIILVILIVVCIINHIRVNESCVAIGVAIIDLLVGGILGYLLKAYEEIPDKEALRKKYTRKYEKKYKDLLK